MNTLAINQLCTLCWSMDEDVAAYTQRGFSGIGLYRRKLDDYGLARTVELLDEHSIRPTSLSWAGGFTGSDGRSFDDSFQDALLAIREAASLGVDTLVVMTGGRNSHIKNHLRNVLLDALMRLAVVAEEFGVNLSLEPMHAGIGAEWSFINDLEACLETVETVNSPNLGIALDTYHVGMDEAVLRWLPDVMPHLKLVQLGDARHSPMGEMNRCLLGEGCIPNLAILQCLQDHRYGGPIEVELIGEDVEIYDNTELLDHTKEFIDRTFGVLN